MTEQIKKDLEDKSFEFILDYLYCKPYSVYEAVTRNKEFMKNLRNQCTPKGFKAFEKALTAYGKVIQERGEGAPLPDMKVCANGEISIDGGKTRSEASAEYRKDNPKVSSCILHYDIVRVNEDLNEQISAGMEGRVLDVYPPLRGTNVISFFVEIPIYTEQGALVTVFTEVIPDKYLKLLKRWDSKKKIYVEDDLKRPVITFNDYSEDYNQFEEYNFPKNRTSAESDRDKKKEKK